MKHNCCFICKHWHQKSATNGQIGWCKRRAPVVFQDPAKLLDSLRTGLYQEKPYYVSRYPLTSDMELCGEYEDKE